MESSGPDYRFDQNKMDENFYEKMREIFLDEVYGTSSKMPRKQYMELVAKKSNWIFNPRKMREIVNREIE